MILLFVSLIVVVLAFVQAIFSWPIFLPIFLLAYGWRSRSDRYFWWLAFWSGLWVDFIAGHGLGRTSLLYLLLMFLFWQWWKKEKETRL